MIPIPITFILIACMGMSALAASSVTTIRVPEGGLQPVTEVDASGIVHMLYYKGEAGAGDLYYAKSTDGGASFSDAIKVNSSPASAIAVGSIRGAHLAVGKNGRIHVAWMGSNKAPKGPGNETPMLYTRLNDAANAFESERNVIQYAHGLDGGGSVAADALGNVYVVWHAPMAGTKGEANRTVFLARSRDDGRTFTREEPVLRKQTGACACCGMRARATSNGNVAVLFRSATGDSKTPDSRDMVLLTSKDKGVTFTASSLDTWKVNQCVMSTAAFNETGGNLLAAWETRGQIHFNTINPASSHHAPSTEMPGAAGKRKHPAIAANATGETIVAWTHGMGWMKGGSVAWQVFDKFGAPTAVKGMAEGVPANSLVSVFARPDGSFSVVY